MAGPHFTTEKILEKQTEPVLAVAFTPDGKTLVTGGRDKNVKVWDVKSGQLLKTLEGHTDWVYTVAIPPDGKTIVSGSRDFTTKVWDLSTGKCLREYRGHREAIHAVIITKDGKRAVSGSEDGTAQVWDINSGTPLNTLRVPGGYVLSLAFTPDERHLIVGNQSGSVIILDLQTGQVQREIKAHSGPWVTAVCATPDGKSVLSGSLEWKAFVHDIATGEKIQDFVGHYGPVYSAILSTDGKYCFLGTSEKVVEIADMATGQVIRKLAGHQQKILALALTKDGSILATGSEDCTARIWCNDTLEWEPPLRQKFDNTLVGGMAKIAAKDSKAGEDFKQALVLAEELGDIGFQTQVKAKIKEFEALKKQIEKEEYERRVQEQRRKEEELVTSLEKTLENIKFQSGEETAFLKAHEDLKARLSKARWRYSFDRAVTLEKLVTERIKEIQRGIIKRIVLTLGTRYDRLLLVEIAEKCEVSDVDLTKAVVVEMIQQKEIAAEYFTSSQTVVFNQAVNNDALTGFIKELDAQFQGWSTTTEKKKT